MNAKNSLLSLKNISVGFDKHTVIQDVSFCITKPEFIVVTGPNGGGKTTLLRLILGLLHPWSGTISVFEKPPKESTSLIGYVPQFSETDSSFPISVQDVILMGTLSGIPLLPFYKKDAIENMRNIADKLGITSLLSHHFGSLSGGQKQRALIARALVSHPKMLLLDEPVASVDSSSEMDIYQLLQEYAQTIPVIMVTHDIGFVSTLVNRIICINRTIYDNPDPTHHLHDTVKEYGEEVRMINHKCGL
ncbi:ABC transporter ATP-binding protein [bacterium]|nr:ABC transporter ATP-binding protein [bacterium]